MSASTGLLRDRAARLWVAVRVGPLLLAEALGVAGWSGVVLLACAAAATSLAWHTGQQAERLQHEAAQFVEAAGRAARATDATTAAGAARAGGPDSAMRADELPDDLQRSAPLPAALLRRAERLGLRVGAVEYRWARRDEIARRLDVQISGTGTYDAARLWMGEVLVALPHAQLVEFAVQRENASIGELEMRLQLALHYRARP